MLRCERGGYCRPEPRGLLRGQAGVELSDDSERVLVGFALPAHAFEVFVYLVVARVVAHEPYHPCFAARFGGLSGGSETHGWRDSSHTAMFGAGKLGSAKLPMATLTYPGKPVLSQYMVEPHVGQK